MILFPPVLRICVKNFNIRCQNVGNGIKTTKGVSDIIIEFFGIYGVKENTTIFSIEDSQQVSITNGSVYSSKNNGTVFVLRSDMEENVYRNILISDIRCWNVKNFAKINYSDLGTKVTFDDITCVSEELNNDNESLMYYINGPCDDINIKRNVSNNLDTFLYTSSTATGDVIIDGINTDAKTVYDLNNVDKGDLTLYGNHIYKKGIGNKKGVIVKNINNKIYNFSKYIGYDETYYTMIENIGRNAKLFDSINMYCFDEDEVKSKTSTTLDIRGLSNKLINWTGDLVLKNIIGMNGQLLRVRSSTAQEISSGGNIILYPSEPTKTFKETLPKYDTYLFKCVDNKWVRCY